jgi:succinylglutamate desuccinylase/aspartoacylase family protein
MHFVYFTCVSELERLIISGLSGTERLSRLGRNINGYFGETIDLPSVMRDCLAAATVHGWTAAEIPVNEKLSLPVFTRSGPIIRRDKPAPGDGKPRVYISAGIHGDEPAGPLAVRHLLQQNKWPADFSFWLCPCLNPSGFLLNRRENADGLDLNRQYLRPQAAETAAHINWLDGQPFFDLCLCLHEDWEAHGFYVYELNPDNQPSLAESMINNVARVCPIDPSELIEGRPARNGIIRPSIDPRDRPQWPEAFYLLTRKTRLSYTLEAPSDFPLLFRVASLVVGIGTALEVLERQNQSPQNLTTNT